MQFLNRPLRVEFYPISRKVWQKYQHLFCSQKIQLVACHEIDDTSIYFIHFPHCQAIIEKHLSDFQKLLDNNFSTEELVQILYTPRSPYFQKMMNDDLLLGILLGYGRGNALLFKTRQRDRFRNFNPKHPWANTWPLPYFCCDPSLEETKELKKIYREDRKKIHWTFFGRDTLEVVIALLNK